MLPGEPEQRASVGRQSRRCDEIVAADQNLAGIAARLREINGNDGVDRLAARRVVLAHADPAIASAIDDAIGISPLMFAIARSRRQRLRRRRAVTRAVEPAIGEVREIDYAVNDGPRGAAIFVHARAGTERLRRQVCGGGACSIAADDHEAALLLRPALEPVAPVAVETRLRERDRLRHDQLGGDGRLPATITCDRRHGRDTSGRNFERRIYSKSL